MKYYFTVEDGKTPVVDNYYMAPYCNAVITPSLAMIIARQSRSMLHCLQADVYRKMTDLIFLCIILIGRHHGIPATIIHDLQVAVTFRMIELPYLTAQIN